MIVYDTLYPALGALLWQNRSAAWLTIYLLLIVPILCLRLTNNALPLSRHVDATVGLLASVAWMTWIVYRATRPLRVCSRRVRIIAGQRVLALRVAGRPALFVRRADCVAIAGNGGVLVLQDGRRINLEVDGANSESEDAFLRELYAVWWPEITLECIRQQLDACSPRRLVLAVLGELALLFSVVGTALLVHNYFGDTPFVVTLLAGLTIAVGVGGYVTYRTNRAIMDMYIPIHVKRAT